MPPKKVLIIGGNGFIGKHAVAHFLQRGYAVRVLDRGKKTSEDKGVNGSQANLLEFVFGDFTNRETLMQALDGCGGCVHLVTTTLPSTSSDDKIFDVETNLIGSIRLLECMQELRISKLVFLSSGGTVYGDPRYTPITEDHPTFPKSSYGITKLAIENYCRLFNQLYGMQAVVLRLSNPYGPGQSTSGIQGAIPVFTAKALRNEPIEIWGDGSVVRDYLHVSDTAEAICGAFEYSGTRTLFNLGYGEGASLNELVKMLSSILGRKVVVDYKPGRSLDVSVNVLDITLIKQELGWAPSIPLGDGLRSVVDALRLGSN